MARTTIEAQAWTDTRFTTLARLLGLADTEHAIIRTARLWSWQTEHYTPDAPTYVVDIDTIESTLGVVGAAPALVRARLAEETPDGYRICGTEGRIEWLWKSRRSSRAGGEATKRKHGDKGRPSGLPSGQAPGSPIGSYGEPPRNEGPRGLPGGLPQGLPIGQPHGKPSLYPDPEEEFSPARAPAIPPSTQYAARALLSPEELAQRREVGRLAEDMWQRVSDSRVAIAAELGLTGIIALPVLSPAHQPTSFRELLERIREEGPAARQVCDHVHEVLCAQARTSGELEWLGEKAFLVGSWREARNASPSSPLPARSRAGPKSSAERAPKDPPRNLRTMKSDP